MTRKVLLIGTDISLLESRSLVLRQLGLMCVTAKDLYFSETTFTAAGFDLVMLCHSLARLDREMLATKIHAWTPRMAILLVHSQTTYAATFTDIDAVLPSNPVQLISALADLLPKLVPLAAA